MKVRRKKSPPASIGAPRVMQDTCTGEGTPSVADSSRNDGVGPIPSGSSGQIRVEETPEEDVQSAKIEEKLSMLAL